MPIREIEYADIPKVIDLLKACDLYYESEDTIEKLERKLTHDKHFMLAFEESGEIVGFVMASFDGWAAIFWHFCVHPDHRKKGIAKTLLEEIKARLRLVGADKMYGLVMSTNKRMLDYSKKNGFNFFLADHVIVTEISL